MEAIRVGAAVSLSGRYREQGIQSLTGISLWVDDVNRDGGLYVRDRKQKVPLELWHYDDQSKRKSTINIVKKLISCDQVDLLIGPYSSALTIEAANVATSLNRVLWNHGGASDAVHAGESGWVVDILTSANSYMRGMIDLISCELPKVRNVAIVSSHKGSFPLAVASGAENYAKQKGFCVPVMLQYDPDKPEFEFLIEQVRRDNAEVIIGVGRIEDDIRLARELEHRNLKLAAVALVAAGIGRFNEELGRLSCGFMGPSQWEPGTPHNVDYGPSVGVMSEKLSMRPEGCDYPVAQAYATGLVAQRCVEEGGTLDNWILRRIAGKLDMTTFFGPFKLDPVTGVQVGHCTLVVQWENGHKVTVWPKELRQAAPIFC